MFHSLPRISLFLMILLVAIFTFSMLSFANSQEAKPSSRADEIRARIEGKITQAFQCTSEVEGQLTCQANKVCECKFMRGSTMTGRPDRWAWDCSILRPQCEIAPSELRQRIRNLPPMYLNPKDFDQRKKKKDKKKDNN